MVFRIGFNRKQILDSNYNIYILASCPWGPVTANGVDLLTEMYVIYMERNTSHRAFARCFGLGPIRILKIRAVGPLSAAGERVTHTWKARKYLMMIGEQGLSGVMPLNTTLVCE